jgi:uncharacterized RDD family membrane protein YckC
VLFEPGLKVFTGLSVGITPGPLVVGTPVCTAETEGVSVTEGLVTLGVSVCTLTPCVVAVA